MIRINKNYIVYHPHYIEKKPKFVDDNDLLLYLSDEVMLDKTVTFERLFDLIIHYSEIFNVIFAKTLGNYKIEDYIKDYNTNKKDDDISIDYLEVFWHSEYWSFKKNKELSCYPSFHGINENYTDKYQKKPCKMNIGIDFSSLYSLRDLKVRINTHVEYRDYIKDEKDVKDRFPLILEGNMEFRLFDIIQAILNEISFYGTPENRDKKSDELKEVSKRIDRGEEKLYEMKIEDGKINFYDCDTGELHDTLGDDNIDE